MKKLRCKILGALLTISTFGKFKISDGAHDSTEATSRQSKTWSVLKYLIALYGKPVPAERLADMLWSDYDYDDPAKMLRQIIYRLRKMLASYGGNQQYIIFERGNYSWNQEVDCWIDVLEFNKLLGQARDNSKSVEDRIELYNAAINLYEGPFLGDSISELWALSFTDYYRRLFLQAVRELSDLYEAEYMLDEIVLLYDKAITCEPYEEPLYIRQIQTLINNGEYAHARQRYRVIERILMREFGTTPSQNLERLSYEIDKATVNEPGSFEDISQLLEAGNVKRGAFFCGPEAFRQIYILDKRSEERIQFPVFLALLTYKQSPGTLRADEDNDERGLKEAMKTLRQVLVSSLRNGDVIAQYSKCQYILMLTALDREGGLTALRRMKYLFENKYGKEKGIIEYQLSPIGKDKINLGFDVQESRKTPK